MASGGWTVLNTWLADAKKTSNIALMLELLQVYILKVVVGNINLIINGKTAFLKISQTVIGFVMHS